MEKRRRLKKPIDSLYRPDKIVLGKDANTLSEALDKVKTAGTLIIIPRKKEMIETNAEKEIEKLQRAVIYLAKELENINHDQYLHKNAVLDILELEEIRDIPKLV